MADDGPFGDFEPDAAEIDIPQALAELSAMVSRLARGNQAIADCVEQLNERLFALESRVEAICAKWN